MIASFGSSKPYYRPAFDLSIEADPESPLVPPEKPLRYGKLPEIRHTFKPEPGSPPKIITILFTAAVIAALPLLLVTVITCYRKVDLANVFNSGFLSMPISTTYQKLFTLRLYHISCFLARY